MPSRASRSRGSVAERRRRKREGAGERAVWIFIGAIATATKAIEGLKLRMDLEKAFDEASFKLRIADITSNLADLKIALGEAKSEAAEKNAEYPASKTSSLSEQTQLSRRAFATKNRATEAAGYAVLLSMRKTRRPLNTQSQRRRRKRITGQSARNAKPTLIPNMDTDIACSAGVSARRSTCS